MTQYPEGIYLLVIRVGEETEIEVGNLSKSTVQGYYLYVGSAHGPGGFKRVSRHLEVSAEDRGGGHWHVDFLTKAGEIVETWLIPTDEDLECKLVRALKGLFDQPIESFGASGCNCYSHLFSFQPSRKSELIRRLNEVAPGVKPIRFDWK